MTGERISQRDKVKDQANLSYLALLNLRPEDLNELRRQGFISREVREGRSCFKLRFRRDDRQVVIGLGKNPELAERIGRELVDLQTERRADREHERLVRAARSLLRRSKCELESALHGAGYRFYGYEIRRLRTEREEHSRQQEA